MKTAIIVLDIFLIVIFVWLCFLEPNAIPEQPVSYAQDIEVIITDIEKNQYYAGTIQREVKVTVYNEEYNVIGKYTEHYVGTFGNMPFWEYQKGDVVKARMIISVIQSTGEVTSRYIDKVY